MGEYDCGILTVSDSCFYHNAEDISGSVILREMSSLNSFNVSKTEIVPDEIDIIQESLIRWSDLNQLNLIITTGGTGFTARDVTPEATMAVIDKNASSISQTLLIESLKITKFAVLSRGISGIRKSTLIINFPGSPKAVKECLHSLSPILPHALDQLMGKIKEVKFFHGVLGNKVSTSVSTMGSDVAGRARSSQFALFTVEDAQLKIFERAPILPSVMVDIADSSIMITSNIVRSRVNVPPYRASIKDGYAVRYADGDGKRVVISALNAGDIHPACVSADTCVRISTGAKVPDDADCVVQVEDTVLVTKDAESGDEKVININIAPTVIGQDIRPIGSDLKENEIIINSGVLITAAEVGLMAMGGIKQIECIRQPIVGILSTGNELVSHTDTSFSDRIIDCNRPLLIALLRSHQFHVVDLGIVKDEPQILLDTLLMALGKCDVLVTTGGVSMGEKDYLKSVLYQDLGAEILFGRIFMKPGKPMTFSTICNRYTNKQLKLVFSLPGNPVSAFVTSYLFVIPTLRKMAGLHEFKSPILHAKMKHDVKLDSRPEYRRCRISSTQLVEGTVLYEVSSKEFGNQISSRLASCIAVDGLICLPPSSETCHAISAGATVKVLKL